MYLVVIKAAGRTAYYLNEDLHRADGPASIWRDGKEGWYLFGEYHRYYGPHDEEEWWIHGEPVR